MKIRSMFLVLLVLLAGYSFAFAQAEQLTLTTYYPSPVGSYDQLASNKVISNMATATTAEFNAMDSGEVHIGKSLIIGSTGGIYSYAASGGSIGDGDVLIKGKVTIGNLSQAGAASAVYSTGGVGAAGILTSLVSSIRYKENIRDYENVLAKVEQLRPVYFTWKSNTATPGMEDFGFIAEEVNKIFPELVTYEDDGKTIRGVKYDKIVILLTKAIQEQQAEIEKLKAKSETQEKLNNELISRISALEQKK